MCHIKFALTRWKEGNKDRNAVGINVELRSPFLQGISCLVKRWGPDRELWHSALSHLGELQLKAEILATPECVPVFKLPQSSHITHLTFVPEALFTYAFQRLSWELDQKFLHISQFTDAAHIRCVRKSGSYWIVWMRDRTCEECQPALPKALRSVNLSSWMTSYCQWRVNMTLLLQTWTFDFFSMPPVINMPSPCSAPGSFVLTWGSSAASRMYSGAKKAYIYIYTYNSSG